MVTENERSTLKKNVGVFDQDVLQNDGYRYTTHAKFSSVVANLRQTTATLTHLGPDMKSVLDAGCGDGTYTADLKRLRPSLDISGFDPSKEAVRSASSRFPEIEFAVGDLLEPATIPNRKFDLVILRGVLHHMSDQVGAIRACRSLGADLLLIEPNGNNPILKVIEKLSPYHREHEEQSFSSRKLMQWCRTAGFDVKSLYFIGFVPFFCPTALAKLIYFLQPFLERVPLLCRFFGAQIVIYCKNTNGAVQSNSANARVG